MIIKYLSTLSFSDINSGEDLAHKCQETPFIKPILKSRKSIRSMSQAWPGSTKTAYESMLEKFAVRRFMKRQVMGAKWRRKR